jgi:hypothetical protein
VLMAFVSDIHGNLPALEAGARPRGRIVRFDYDPDRTIAALRKTSLPKGLRKDFAEGSKMRFQE